MRENMPILGVGIFVINANREVLLGKRINTERGDGLYSIPGGHVEPFECLRSACMRELCEETGLRALSVNCFAKITFTEDQVETQRYITFYYFMKVPMCVRPINKEPNKCEGWKWIPLREAYNMKLFCDSQIVLCDRFE